MTLSWCELHAAKSLDSDVFKFWGQSRCFRDDLIDCACRIDVKHQRADMFARFLVRV